MNLCEERVRESRFVVVLTEHQLALILHGGLVPTRPQNLLVATVGLEAWVSASWLGQTGTLLRCVESGPGSDALARDWRAYLAPEDDEPEDELLVFCPDCAEREFGPSGWEQTS